MIRSDSDLPVTPLPNPGEGGMVWPGDTEEHTPVIPLPNPGEGGAVWPGDTGEHTPVIPLPNPGEGGAVWPGGTGPACSNPGGSVTPGAPIYPGGGGVVTPLWPTTARVRFLNAAYGYPAFRVFVGNVQMVNYLGFTTVSPYRRINSGYQTVTIAGTDGYVYIQKTIPFSVGSVSTVAVINRAGGLDLLQIFDTCCTPSSEYSNFRVSNLAYNSGPMDVLLADGRVVYADVRFKETTVYKRIRPGEYEFLFAETNLMPSPSYVDIETLDSAFIGTYPVANMVASAYVRVQRNAKYTVFLINSGTAKNAIQTMTVEDADS